MIQVCTNLQTRGHADLKSVHIQVPFSYLSLPYSIFIWAENTAVQAHTKKLRGRRIYCTTKCVIFTFKKSCFFSNQVKIRLSALPQNPISKAIFSSARCTYVLDVDLSESSSQMCRSQQHYVEFVGWHGH